MKLLYRVLVTVWIALIIPFFVLPVVMALLSVMGLLEVTSQMAIAASAYIPAFWGVASAFFVMDYYKEKRKQKVTSAGSVALKGSIER